VTPVAECVHQRRVVSAGVRAGRDSDGLGIAARQCDRAGLERFRLPLAMSGVEVLINGIAAPLYYVSPGLVNVQIPYDVSAGSAMVRRQQ